MSAAGLILDGVHKSYQGGAGRVEVLQGVDLAVAPGEAVAITGPSGCGKSTLLHIVGGLDSPDSGRVTLDGADPHALPEPERASFRNRTIGFVFQGHHLLPQYSVLENVLLPTRAGGAAPAGAGERARHLLDVVGLGHRLHHRPAELSGGERQRTAVARALINEPRLLLCDEPTGSLDHASAEAVGGLLLDLQAREGSILLVVTHSLDLAARFPRRVGLAEGRCSGA